MKTLLSQIQAKTLAKAEQDRARVEGRPLSYQQALDVVAKAHGFAHTHEMVAARQKTTMVFQVLDALREKKTVSIVARSATLDADTFGLLTSWRYGQAFAVLDATMLMPEDVQSMPLADGTIVPPYNQEIIALLARASIVYVSGLAQSLPVVRRALMEEIFFNNAIMGVPIPHHVVVVLDQSDLSCVLKHRCVCLDFTLADFGTKRDPGHWIALGVQAKRLSKTNAAFLSQIPSSDPRTPYQMFKDARVQEILALGPLVNLCKAISARS